MPGAYVDSWLISRFPGKTLEELDQMDWARYMRAVEVENLRNLAMKHGRYLNGQADITDHEWAIIAELTKGSDG